MIGEDHRELFCAGHTLDEDGNVVFMGGHDGHGSSGDNHGITDVWLYKWNSGTVGTWQQMADMAHGRWYPTVIQLPDRTFMGLMGTYYAGTVFQRNTTPDLWTMASGVSSPTNYLSALAARNMDDFYPHTFIHPLNGRPFYAAKGMPGADFYQNSGLYNPLTLQWDSAYTIPSSGFNNVRQTWPSGVMMDGVIYRSGGSISDASTSLAVATTTRLDLNQAAPSWQELDEMEQPRKNHTLVALPDARLVALGGNLQGTTTGSTDRAQPEALDTEQEIPAPQWTSLQDATSPIGRGYHSTALLLPDASIVFAGGEIEPGLGTSWNVQRRAHFFTPHYGSGTDPNWQANRPAIQTPAPSVIRYGEPCSLNVSVASGHILTKLRLISLGATTHAFNENQQFLTLMLSSTVGVPGTFWKDPSIANRYVLTPPALPAGPYRVRPGYYMLFAVDDFRLPSVAAIVNLKDYVRVFPNTVTLGNEEVGYENNYETYPETSEILLADNKYYGTSLQSFPGDVEYAAFKAMGSFPATSYAKLRIKIEMRTSLAVDYVINCWNYSTLTWNVVGSGTTSTSDSELLHEVTSSFIPYISTQGEVQAFVELSGNSSTAYTLRIDRIEFGARPLYVD